MAKFECQGRVWTVDVNVATIKRVRQLLDVDLLDLAGKGKLVQRLITDPILLVDVIYVVCKPQADELKISDEDFGRMMKGDAIDQATHALLESMVAFSPSPRDRANLGRVLKAANRAMDKARDAIEEELDEKLDELVERAAARASRTLGDSSSSAPASSASTPAPSP